MPPSLIWPSFADQTILNQAFNRIVSAIRSKSADFLFGAGMSLESGVPFGLPLKLKLLETFFPSQGINPPAADRRNELAGLFPFEALAEAIGNMPGRKREDMTELLKEIFLSPDYNPTQVHRDFLSICMWSGQPRFQRIFTTNYDLLFEKLLGTNLCVSINELNANQIRHAQQDGTICVIHLHGTLDMEGFQYKITETDLYDRKYSILTNAFSTALYEASTFVFIGYSMNDPDFRDVYMQFRQEIINIQRLDRTAYVVSPAANEHEYALGREIWNRRGAIWIPLTAAQFFRHLKELIESQLGEGIRRNVGKKYDVCDENALDELIEKTADILRIGKDDALLFLDAAKS